MATGQRRFLLVVVDYFSKWVEAERLARITEHMLDHAGGSWVNKLPSVLWALRMTPKEGTGITPFHLVYGGETVIPVEVGVESDPVQYYNEGNAKWRLMELDLMDEIRAKAAVWLAVYRQRMKQNYNRRVISKSF
ncbi:uncharacterized protein LOC122022971 [Zingiber officinale]|uniref:uncharacterized protein LOC122022971 n=1 Tax=Zingiber officinale TaxID=94328 RepID=UPI001C4BD167|nr:uncharacterized protein LOC122022971 [Zingiber officinale]